MATNSNQKSFKPVFLDTLKKTNTELNKEDARSIVKTQSIVEPERFQTIYNHLAPLWEAKQLKTEVSQDFLFHVDGIGGNSNHPGSNGSDYIQTRSTLCTTVSNATVYPILNLVEVGQGFLIADRFASSNESFYSFCQGPHGRYFGYDQSEDAFVFQDNEQNAPIFKEQVQVSTPDHTPILLSNHLHDMVYAHWFAVGLEVVFQITKIRDAVRKPLFVIGYIPKSWQLEAIEHYFNEMNAAYTIIDRPVTFTELTLVSLGLPTVFLDGSFLRTLYLNASVRLRKFAKRKIFIYRGQSKNRRITNQRELNTLLLKLNYEIHCMENYSFADQISLIASCEKIIFVEGASGMNLLHAKPECTVGIIAWDHQGRSHPFASCWHNICHNFGLFRTNVFKAEVKPVGGIDFDLEVDISRFEHFTISSNL